MVTVPQLVSSLVGLVLSVLTSVAMSLRPFDGLRARRRTTEFALGQEVAVPIRWEDVPPNTAFRKTYSVQAVVKCQGDGWTCENWNSLLGPPELFLAQLAGASTEINQGWVTIEIRNPRFGGAIAVLLRESDLDILRACVVPAP
jgi:hypothetical protein